MNILITGSSRGIGAAMVRELASYPGWKVFITSRNMKAMEEIRQSSSGKADIIIIPADLGSPASVSELVTAIREHTNHLDILINNAGYLKAEPFENQDYQSVLTHFQVNYLGPSMLIRECLSLLQNSTDPHVVNISSMGGFQGSEKFPGLSHYSASKGAMAILTECLAREYKSIRFNCLCIGSVQTEMLEEAFPGYKASLKPEEMAEYILDFAQKAHHYMNGKIIPVAFSSP